eukprot:11794767-Ditylum_brightwellii.AAC.1
MWGGKVSLNKKSLVLLVTSSKSHKGEPQILCHVTLPSGDVLCVAANAACKSRTDAAPDEMNNV